MTASARKRDIDLQINPQRGGASNGPSSDRRALAAAEAHCRRIALGHYENFVVASILLPRRMRQPFYNVYAFCRHADDLADESPSPAVALQRLAQWRGELERCFAGEAEHPIFIALSVTVARFGLSQQPFNELLDAFRQDQSKTRYADFAQLQDYCRRSANPVGRIVLRLAEADTPENIELSDQICTGLQLANHWQDVRRDFHSGRVYLPQDAMVAHGVDPAMLGADRATDALKRLITVQCERARGLLQSGLPLAQRVPRWLAADVRLIAHGGLATLDAIAAIDHDVLGQRPTLSRWQQTRLTLRAFFGRL